MATYIRTDSQPVPKALTSTNAFDQCFHQDHGNRLRRIMNRDSHYSIISTSGHSILRYQSRTVNSDHYLFTDSQTGNRFPRSWAPVPPGTLFRGCREPVQAPVGLSREVGNRSKVQA